MLTKQIYICEICGRQSFDKEEIQRCEAKHLGLTADEMAEWEGLRNQFMTFKRISRTNRDAKAVLNCISANLNAFERQHGLAVH